MEIWDESSEVWILLSLLLRIIEELTWIWVSVNILAVSVTRKKKY